MTIANLGTIIVSQSRCKILPLGWIQSYPCKTKTFQETEESLKKFLEPTRKPRVIYTNNSIEFGKACEDLSWNLCTSTPHRSEISVVAESAERRINEGTSAVLLPGETLNHLVRWSNNTLFPTASKKVLPEIFFGYVLYAGRIWKGDPMVTDIEELERMDASEIHAERLNAKEVLTPMSGEKGHHPDRRWNNLLRTSTSIRDNPDRG